jgi:hypothetical protein
MTTEGSGSGQRGGGGGRGAGGRGGGGGGAGGAGRGQGGGTSGVNWDSLVDDVFYEEVKEMVNSMTDQHKE